MRIYKVLTQKYQAFFYRTSDPQSALIMHLRDGHTVSEVISVICAVSGHEPEPGGTESVIERARRLLASRFTPEPWEVFDEEDGPDTFDGYVIWHDDGQPGDMIICKGFAQGPDEGLADAQFVAAAPTLVRRLLEVIDTMRDDILEELALERSLNEAERQDHPGSGMGSM